uniref:Uncharacterized protein n=1 Tax=viral metagenome TaxID=1070528 RepID=A0A6M3J0D9_9ZZZZ
MKKMYDEIKKEIQNDPEGRGYKDKTDAQIKDLLNEPYTTDRVVQDFHPARIHEILIGVAETPNIVAVTDVTTAKKVILPAEVK